MDRPTGTVTFLFTDIAVWNARMDRRAFFGAAATFFLLPCRLARAQASGRVYRIGILESIPASENTANLEALRRGLRERGYVEGNNLNIEYRSADGDADRFPALAAELVRLPVDLIVTRGTPATNAAKAASLTVPVLMATMGDPRGIVASFAQPGGNVTGVTTFSTELTAKKIELLKELVPHLSRVALLQNMSNPAAVAEWGETKAAAHSLGIEAHLLDVRDESDLRRAIEKAPMQHVDALIVGADGLTQMHRAMIVDRIAASRLPAAYPGGDFVAAGGLMAYAVNYPDLYYRFAGYADKIFKGAKPGELPIEQPTKFVLSINLRTAKAFGITVPESLRVRADELIR